MGTLSINPPLNQAETALDLASKGFCIIPAKSVNGKKFPLTEHGVNNASNDVATVNTWFSIRFPDAVPGIACGHGIVVIDTDVKNGKQGPKHFYQLCVDHNIDQNNFVAVQTPSGGFHFYFKSEKDFINGTDVAGLNGVDVRSRGGWVVAPGTQGYELIHGSLESIPQLPEALETGLLTEKEVYASHSVADTPQAPATSRERAYAASALSSEFDKLKVMGLGSGRNAALNKAAHSMGTMTAVGWIDCPTVVFVLLAVAHYNGYVAKDGYREAWNTIHSGFNAGMKKPRSPLPDHKAEFGEIPPPEEWSKTAGVPDFSDEHGQSKIAAEMAFKIGDYTISITNWGWHKWNGHKYEKTDDKAVFGIASKYCKDASNVAIAVARKSGAPQEEIDKILRAASGMNSAGYIAGVRTIYESKVLVNNNLFDIDPWQLNTAAGLIDCKTGVIDTRATLRYCTKATAVAPDPNIDITPWLDMIAAHDGSDEWMNYHQRVAFYCLTGSTAHDAIFVLQGPPGTGKSSFFGTLGKALGDYSTTVKDSDMFLVNKNRNEHPTEFADFAGTRIVVVDELPKGAVLNTTLLNKMTSGTGKARFMRQDYFQYTIQHKVTFTTNYEPRFKSLRDGFVRRVHMIPWWTQPATINTKLRDEILPAILPGILHWALQGRESYLKLGLEKPKAVADYTAKYLVSQNTIQQWIDARCELNPKEKSRAGETFNDWKAWAEDNGHYVGDISEFKANLLAIDGIGYDEDWRGRYYTGFKLKPSFPSSDPDADHWKQSEQPINVNGVVIYPDFGDVWKKKKGNNA